MSSFKQNIIIIIFIFQQQRAVQAENTVSKLQTEVKGLQVIS
jgi:hypothetical protein